MKRFFAPFSDFQNWKHTIIYRNRVNVFKASKIGRTTNQRTRALHTCSLRKANMLSNIRSKSHCYTSRKNLGDNNWEFFLTNPFPLHICIYVNSIHICSTDPRSIVQHYQPCRYTISSNIILSAITALSQRKTLDEFLSVKRHGLVGFMAYQPL